MTSTTMPPVPNASARPTTPPQFVAVLVDCPGQSDLFTYRVPPGLTIRPGDILSVALGPRQVGGIALQLLSAPPAHLELAQVRDVGEVLTQSFFPPTYWPLLQQVADYYHTSLMAAIRVALPPGLLRRSQRRVHLLATAVQAREATLSEPAQRILARLRSSKTGDCAWSYLQQQIKGADRGLRELRQQGWIETRLHAPATAQPKRQQRVLLLSHANDLLSPRQREVLQMLQRAGGELWLQDAVKRCKTTPTTLRKLAELGCVAITTAERLRLDHHAVDRDRPPPLTPNQADVLAQIHGLSGSAEVLLHGVTGSGKTEIYLQAIAPRLAAGQSALVLVPEIGLTPQLTDRFRARFGGRVRVYHSALSEGERYDTWRAMTLPDPQVVIGTRSAIFAPLPNLGLIVLDEEHDSGYKQDQPAPCYHARTVARWRSHLEQCPLILGSATPSVESWYGLTHQIKQAGTAVKQSQLPSLYLSLPERINSRPLPPITVVDMRQELQMGNRSMFSQGLQAALKALAETKQQGILFVQRRGHSTFVSCRSCGYVMECPHCSVSLTYHEPTAQSAPLLRCHYCNHVCRQPKTCPSCQSPYFRFFGTGTQRVLQALEVEFPTLRLLRFDSDTTRRKGAHRQLLQQFAAGEVDLMIGTQMLTKGIDLPQVQLVGVLAADGLLNLPDFRATERAMQTLLQVAGRAGRGDQPGQVILQTYSPDHPVIQAVQAYEYPAFMTAELAQRSPLRYPPYGRLMLFRLSCPEETRVVQAAQHLTTQLQALMATAPFPSEVLGPAPAGVLRVAGRYRWQLLLKLPPNTENWQLPLAQLKKNCDRQVRITLDVDPLNLL